MEEYTDSEIAILRLILKSLAAKEIYSSTFRPQDKNKISQNLPHCEFTPIYTPRSLVFLYSQNVSLNNLEPQVPVEFHEAFTELCTRPKTMDEIEELLLNAMYDELSMEHELKDRNLSVWIFQTMQY